MPIKHSYDKIVYFLQGGGALGSYQAGVFEALSKNGFEPDWVVGTSIGAVNAGIIAGNEPKQRIAKLKEFWNAVSNPLHNFTRLKSNSLLEEFQNYLSTAWVMLYGQSNFFRPRLINPLDVSSNKSDELSFYDTTELRETLKKVIDFDIINQKKVRLTLGAVRIKGGELTCFDNTRRIIGPEHIMASGALPPGFPAVKIDDEYYWDGGLSSNTPFAIIMKENVPQKLLCIIINLFSYPEQNPTSLMDVFKFRKEIEFASRHHEILSNFCELRFLQNTIKELAKTVKNNEYLDRALKRIAETGHPTALNIARFHYQDRPSDLWSEDFNFSPEEITKHWTAGYIDGEKACIEPTWLDMSHDFGRLIIHEF